MPRVRDILEQKGHVIHALGPNEMVLDALKCMAENEIGAVLVLENGALIGIFTERHYARNVFLKGRASPDTRLRDVMARNVIRVTPDETAEACMGLMTEKRVRHLPVESGGTLVGIISIGDLMKSIIADREFDIDQLVHYVSGT